MIVIDKMKIVKLMRINIPSRNKNQNQYIRNHLKSIHITKEN